MDAREDLADITTTVVADHPVAEGDS